MSKHLRILREAGLLTVRNAAQKRLYCLNAKPWHAEGEMVLCNAVDFLNNHNYSLAVVNRTVGSFSGITEALEMTS